MKFLLLCWILIIGVDTYLNHLDTVPAPLENCRKVMSGYIMCDDGKYVYYSE